jgi:ribosomal protein S2
VYKQTQRKLSIRCCLVTRMQSKIMTKIANRCFENLAKFRYLGTTITNQNLVQEEIKMRLNSGNACYHHSVQNPSSSHLLSKNIKN